MTALGRVLGIAAALIFVSACGGGGGGSGDSGTPRNVATSVSSVQEDAVVVYRTNIPRGATQLLVELTELSQDADLEVFGASSREHCLSERVGTTPDTCTFTNPTPGVWTIEVYGYSSGTTGYRLTVTLLPSNLTLTLAGSNDAPIVGANFMVTATAGAGGTISPPSVSVSYTDTASFTVTPSNGYQIETVSGCGGSLSGNTYTTGPINSNCVATATFSLIPCSIPHQNQAVYNTMQQHYLWYEELPVLDPQGFESPEALLDALLFKPLDRLSQITTQAEEEVLFGESQFIGFGFLSMTVGATVRITDAFEGTPSDQAGLVRGSTILAVDGVPIADVLAAPGGFSGALGPAEIGVGVTLQFRNPDGSEFTRTLVKDVVTVPPVTAARVFEVNGQPTGYLVFRNFVDPGIAALDAAFAEFRAAGVTQLIVDLRYNGGGRIWVLQHFADLLGSRIAPAAVFAGYAWNDKNSSRNQLLLFGATPPPSALDLERLVFITTPATASASEVLVNGMAPHVTTVSVGSETFGKPVGETYFRFCELVLRAVSFRTFNSLGENDFFDGIPADCPAGDTLDVAFGTPGEASFDTAVGWLEQGFCP